MSRRTDIDPLLRGWLDEGDVAPPERYVWAALERVETTRQRGAVVVSLEELIMRAQPILVAAAVALLVVIGLAAYVALAGGQNIGEPDATATEAAGTTRTEEFGTPLTLAVPDGWTLVESQNAVVMTRLDGSAIREQISIFDERTARLWSGTENSFVAWPDDLATWLEMFPVVTDPDGFGSIDIVPTEESTTTVNGASATVIDATTSAGLNADMANTLDLIVSPEGEQAGTDAQILGGDGRIRFVLLDGDLVMVYHAGSDDFSEATVDAVVASLRLIGE